MGRWLELSNEILFVYYLASNLIYLALLITAVWRNTWHRRRLASLRLERLQVSPFTPPITLIVPAHNEEAFIVASVRALSELYYPDLEIVVVNDGSRDNTLSRLKSAFQLRAARLLYLPQIATAQVRESYRSAIDPRLLVLDKEPAGSKADAINAGINVASSPYICVVDADSILEKESLLRIMAGVFADSQSVVAAGGIVRVLNGCELSNGELREVGLPRHSIEILQIIEYLRAFLIGREAWAYFNALPIISGAFGIFSTDLVREVNGFRPHAIGEDFDLVVRMHRRLHEQQKEYHIAFVPDPTCWTEVPSDLRSLARQRARWHKGLIDTLWPNRDMLCRRRYGRVGWVLLYMWVFEFMAPLVELIGYSTIILAAVLGMLSRQFFVLFLIFGYAFATLISIGSVLLEEMTYRRYSDWREVGRLLFFCLFEHFPYRQMTMLWRLQGIWQYLRGDLAWGEIKRMQTSTGAMQKQNATRSFTEQ
jgi:cellulose synthase/poly-beta-1,6-N-acetylglucosamine synthase-like glycosyltransferase